MAKLTPLCNICSEECYPNPDMCAACRASYKKACKHNSGTGYLMRWAASVARESEYRRAHHFEAKKQRLHIEETRRQLTEQETTLARREARAVTNWRDDPAWSRDA